MEILYSNHEIAVCIKPVGMDSEAEVPAALKEQLGGEIFPIHRLDKNVGGVMVYARTKQAAAQAFATASYTLGCAAGNFAGGQLLTAFDLRTMLLAGIAMAASGTLVFFLTVEKNDL